MDFIGLFGTRDWKRGVGLKKEKFDVTGMTCSACSSRVETCVGRLEGVEELSVNLLTNSMVVRYDEAVTGPETIEIGRAHV